MSPLLLTRYRLSVLLALLCALVVTGVPGPVTQSDTSSIVAIVGKLDPSDLHPEQLVTRAGGKVLRKLAVVDGFVARMPRRLVPALSHMPGVRFVSPNRTMHLLAQYGQDTGVASAVYTDVTRASRVWSSGLTGSGVTGSGVNVALIDTGVNTSGDLAGRVAHSEDFTVEQDGQDNYGHGTFVAGMIAGTGAGSLGAVKGAAPGSKIVSLKIAGRDGSTDVTMVLEALGWLLTFKDTYNIRVVNLSLGFDSQQSYRIDPLDFAVERVWNAGIVVVAAAGNTPGVVTSPGNDPYVITAGSSNDKTTLTLGDDGVASFSGGGTTPDLVHKPDVYAPGKSVVSSRSPGSTIDTAFPTSAIGASYARGSGTSFSTGLVSGIAALTLARTPTLTPNQVKQRLVSTTRFFGTTPGLVDAWGAVTSLDMTAANTGLSPATGTGSLQATRGAACLRDDTGACMSDEDANEALGVDPAEYLSDTWAGQLWLGSQWLGSQWLGSQWVGSQWLGSQWVGSQWVGSQWMTTSWSSAPWSFSPDDMPRAGV
jgi:serine protease AprX